MLSYLEIKVLSTLMNRGVQKQQTVTHAEPYLSEVTDPHQQEVLINDRLNLTASGSGKLYMLRFYSANWITHFFTM